MVQELPTVTAPRSAGSTPAVDGSALTQPFGCGWGFAAGNADQSVGLVVSLKDPKGLPAEVELPRDGWQAEVWIGRDLFANWCGDVIVPNSPSSDVREKWPIVEGTVKLDPIPTPFAQCGQSPVTFTATGLVAQRPDNSLVDLGTLTVKNETFGCFSG